MAITSKYQLIQPPGPATVEHAPARGLFKIILACAGLVLTICYYNLPITEAEATKIQLAVSTVSQAEEFRIEVNTSNLTLGNTDITLITSSNAYRCRQDPLKMRTTSSTLRGAVCRR